ncbi:hypothetical protein FOZ63_001376 [Perkinsus olseni]|uniref:Uncharacterized protein n=1 Tax=Perkinsus olseni TaxID=32597 RepID=A0A7J6TZ48_PEROL|nr:hypothetical protein FOZ63_001376 [Perkinsus olseni]
MASALDPLPFEAWWALQDHKYQQNESADGYLADLRRLLVLSGLPETVSAQVRLSAAPEASLGLSRVRGYMPADGSGSRCYLSETWASILVERVLPGRDPLDKGVILAAAKTMTVRMGKMALCGLRKGEPLDYLA